MNGSINDHRFSPNADHRSGRPELARAMPEGCLHLTSDSIRDAIAEHNVMDLVTVLSATAAGQPPRMTSLRQQCDRIGEAGSSNARPVSDASLYTAQVGQALPPEQPSAHFQSCDQRLLFYPFGGIDVASALALAWAGRCGCIVFAGAELFADNAQSLSMDLCRLADEEGPTGAVSQCGERQAPCFSTRMMIFSNCMRSWVSVGWVQWHSSVCWGQWLVRSSP